MLGVVKHPKKKLPREITQLLQYQRMVRHIKIREQNKPTTAMAIAGLWHQKDQFDSRTSCVSNVVTKATLKKCTLPWKKRNHAQGQGRTGSTELGKAQDH